MFTLWTQHISDPKEKEDFVRYVKNSRALLDPIKQMLEQKERELDKSETTAAVYDSPNWDYRQADKNGYRRCLNELKTFVDLDKQQ